MSFRKKTIKFGGTFGTPTTPTVTTPKAPSPRATGGIPTATTPTAITRPTVTRKVITPTAAGIAVQEEFKQQLQSNPIVIAANQVLNNLYQISKSYDFQRFSTPTEKDLHQRNIQDQEQKIQDVEHELIEVELAANVQQIIGAIESGKLVIPDYFQNNIIWVKSGAITSQAFLDSYYYLSNQGIIHAPIAEPEIIEEPIIEEPFIEIPELLPEVIAEPDSSITDNMVTQQLINFNIVNGRAVGSIKFVATNNFNPYWYGKNLVNIIQFKDPNGANILTYVKENRLNFTETEREEIISYDEDMKGNTRATVESFVWSSATQPSAFSKMYSIEISEAEPPKPIQAGFMGAGVAGAIAGLILIGFIADHKRGNR